MKASRRLISINTIAGETGLPGKVVGMVDVRERHLFADVASEHERHYHKIKSQRV